MPTPGDMGGRAPTQIGGDMPPAGGVRVKHGRSLASVTLMLLLSLTAVQSVALNASSPAWDWPLRGVSLPVRPMVEPASGNLRFDSIDVAIPGKGFALEIQRVYNSRSGHRGVFGHGWSSNLDVHARNSGKKTVEVVEADGSVIRYYASAQKGKQGDPTFTSAAFPQATLVRLSAGGYERRTGSVLVETFGRDGYLREVRDAYGNVLTIVRTAGRLEAVRNNSGRALAIQTDAEGRVTAVSDPLGRTWTYGYDAAGDLVLSSAPGRGKTLLTYDRLHNLERIVYPDGARQEFGYDPVRDVVLTAHGPGDDLSRFEYRLTDGAGGEVTVFDGSGNRTRHVRSSLPSGSELTLTDAQGGSRRKLFDVFGNLLESVDEKGNRTRFRYDECHRLTARADPEGNTWRYEYSDRDCSCRTVTAETRPDGTRQEYRRDARGALVGQTDASAIDSEVSYEEFGLPAQVRNEIEGTVTYRYNREGDLVGLSVEGGTEVQFERDVVGRLTGVTVPGADRVRFTYDDADQLTRTAVGDRVRTYQFDPLGRLVSAVGDLGTVRARYGADGRILERTVDGGPTMRFSYNALGLLTSVAAEGAGGVELGYDSLGRVLSVRGGYGSGERLEYDVAGNLVRRTDPFGRVEEFRYDRAGHSAGYTDPGGHQLTLRSDWSGRVLWREDETGYRAGREYDPDGRLTALYDNAGRARRVVVDRAGRPVLTIDGNGNLSEGYYDPRGRLLEVRYGDRSVQVHYDPDGRRVHIDDPVCPIIFRHDHEGRLAEESYPVSGAVLHREYDAFGRVVRLSGTGGYEARFTYEGDGPPVVISGLGGAEARLSYDAGARLREAHLGKVLVVRHGYDEAGRPTRIEYARPDGSVLYRFEARYGSDGKVAGLQEGDAETTLTHDAAGRLLRAVGPGSAAASFAYDAAGNRTRETSIDETGGRRVSTYRYGPGHRIASVRTERSGADTEGSRVDEASFAFDAEGNLISRRAAAGETRYHYGARNALQQVDLADGSRLQYRYDLFGRRTGRSQGVDEQFMYYAGRDLIQVLDADNRPLLQAVYGPSAEAPLFYREGKRTLFPVRNLQGTVVAVVGDDGTVVEEVRPTLFGVMTGRPGTQPLRFGLHGRPYDATTGLYDFGARDYDPRLGRFLQPDPVEPERHLNLYVFAGNDPVNLRDPDGRSAQDVARQRSDAAREALANTEAYIRKLKAWRDSANAAERAQFAEAGGQKELNRAVAAWGERKNELLAARAASPAPVTSSDGWKFTGSVAVNTGVRTFSLDVEPSLTAWPRTTVNWRDSYQVPSAELTGSVRWRGEGRTEVGWSFDIGTVAVTGVTDPHRDTLIGLDLSLSTQPPGFPNVPVNVDRGATHEVGQVTVRGATTTARDLYRTVQRVYTLDDALSRIQQNARQCRPRGGRR